jgi:hypothetical protein
VLSNIALNLPHVVFSSIMLYIAYVMAPREEQREATARPVTVPAQAFR